MSANPSYDQNYVINQSDPAPEPPVEPPVDPAALQAQIDQLNLRLEHEATLRNKAEEQSEFWFNTANRKLEQQQPAPVQQQAPPPVAPQLTEDRYNLILTNPQEMQKYVDEVSEYKARAIAGEVATQVADQKADQITGYQRRIQTAWNAEVNRMRQSGAPSFGVAGDPITDLFGQKVQLMMQDPSFQGMDPVIAMRLAIREAEADYFRQYGGQGVPPGVPPENQQQYDPGQQQQQPTYPRNFTSQQQQQQRDAAIAAQAGSRGRRPAPPEQFNNIPADQMAMLEKHARGLGIPVEKIIQQMPRVVQFRKQGQQG